MGKQPKSKKPKAAAAAKSKATAKATAKAAAKAAAKIAAIAAQLAVHDIYLIMIIVEKALEKVKEAEYEEATAYMKQYSLDLLDSTESRNSLNLPNLSD